MTQKSAAAIQPAKENRKSLPASDLLTRVQDTYNAIARRAFEAFEGRGRADGHDLEDWFRAESELLHPLHLEITETDHTVTIQAEVPGFSAKDLEVSLEAHHLIIMGKRTATEERKAKKTLYSEHCSNQIFRSIELPTDVDTSKVTATIKDGVLELVMPKAANSSKKPVEHDRA